MAIDRLLSIMARLRDPAGGCPWDREQNFASIAPHTIEEAYEVADAIDRGDLESLRDELGDLLFQVVFHSRLAGELNAFAFDDVVDAICDKLTRRHPHVFADIPVDGVVAQSRAWERIKAAERREKGRGDGALADIPVALPALTRARKLGRRASDAGFDWPDSAGPRAKIDEELTELDRAKACHDATRMDAEIGDLLFSVVNLARHLDIDPEAALRRANDRFSRRFHHVERALTALGLLPSNAGATLLDRLWTAAKAENP